MKKRIIALMLVLQIVLSFTCAVYADETATTEIVEIPEEDVVLVPEETVETVVEVPEDTLTDVAEEIVDVPEDALTDVAEEIVEVPEEVLTDVAEEEVIEVTAENEDAEKKLSSKRLVLYVNVVQPEGEIVPGNMLINIFSEDGTWLSNNSQYIDKAGEYVYEFYLPEYEAGTKFKVYLSDGVEYIEYGNTRCYQHQCFTFEAVIAYDIAGQPYISDAGGITASPKHTEMWEYKAEKFVNEKGIASKTPFMIWVSKKNYTVSVLFADGSGSWKCIKSFGCSIGAPSSPTVTGEFEYHQYQKAWDYGTYYVGPVMRFYRGYAIHTTLIKKDGTDYDGRIGKMISHGCVRVRPENMEWLVKTIPLNTKVYVTND